MAGRVAWKREWNDNLELAEEWESVAPDWIKCARAPGYDSYWRYHRDRFLELLPPPPLAVLDMGCGEGRLPRDLKQRGYAVSGVDVSPTLIAAALDLDPDGTYRVAAAGDTGFADSSFDTVVAFLSLHDMDALHPAIAEAARVLRPAGWLCMAMVHPLNSAGSFESSEPEALYRLEVPYLQERRYADDYQDGEYRMRFASIHRPMGAYFDALERHGFLTERVREIPNGDPAPNLQPGQRHLGVPLFLHIRAVLQRVA
jgi:SAM-dependent methyltransferase